MQLTTYQEGSAKLLVPSGSFQDAFHQPVFFNPHMRFNRSVSSLAFQASMDVLGKSKAPASEQALVVDGLCALGSRGIRYAAENSGVKKVFFVDANSDAVPILKKNIAANKLSKRSKVHFGDLNRFFLNAEDFFDFIEIDPFGSPVYFLENAVGAFRDGYRFGQFVRRAHAALHQALRRPSAAQRIPARKRLTNSGRQNRPPSHAF